MMGVGMGMGMGRWGGGCDWVCDGLAGVLRLAHGVLWSSMGGEGALEGIPRLYGVVMSVWNCSV